MPMRIPLKDLNLIDNFLFNELIMQEDKEKSEEFVRSILEPIIQKKIGKLEFEGQKIIQGTDTNRRGIQMDAYVKVYETIDGEEIADVTLQEKPVIYDIEPNNIQKEDTKRARLYHSIIDANVIKSGTPFKDIPDVYVIFILPYDPFGKDYMLYTTLTMCKEDTSIPIQDGSTTLFLYTNGSKNIPSQEIANMLKFFINSTAENATDAHLENIHKMMEDIKSKTKVEVKYMQSWEEKEYYMELGEKKGKIEGKVEGKVEYLMLQLSNIGNIPSELRELITSQSNEDILSKWFLIAMNSTSIEEFQSKLEIGK